MGYSSAQVKKEFLKEILAETIEEEVQAGLTTVGAGVTTPQKVAEGVVADEYDAVIMGIAVEQIDQVGAWIKRAAKQVFKDGLEAAGLAALAQEIPLLVKLKAKEAWELGLTNTSGSSETVGWRIRIRHIKKE